MVVQRCNGDYQLLVKAISAPVIAETFDNKYVTGGGAIFVFIITACLQIASSGHYY